MTVPVPSKEELELVRESVLLPYMLTIIQNNSNKIRYANFPEWIRTFYLAADNHLMDHITRELDVVRKKLREANIKVTELDQDESAIHYEMAYRGYVERFSLWKQVARSQLSERLGDYIAELPIN